MRFMFFGPEVCLGLPSDSASPRTPLPPTTATAAFTAQDLHLVDNAHAGHTKGGGPHKAGLPSYFYPPASGCRKQERRWSFTSPVACMWA